VKKTLSYSLIILSFVLLTCEEENNPPTCKIVAPNDNTSFYRGDTVTISIEASDPDGTISEIRLYIDGFGIASWQSFPFNYDWITAEEDDGQHEIVATAIDKKGAKASSTIYLNIQLSLPLVTTFEITEFTPTTACCNGYVKNYGYYPISKRGFVWDTIQGPTIEKNLLRYTILGGDTGDFTCCYQHLSNNTTYYVNAYATNQEGTAYGEEKTFTTLNYWTEKGTFTDNRDGQTYNWIKIGEQIWMEENLAFIPHVSPVDEQGGIWVSGYSGLVVDSAITKDTYQNYGCLYDWTTARESCPDGWHLPSRSEWSILIDYMGDHNFAGGNLKATGISLWSSPNTGATNESGFSALPGGYRSSSNNDYDGIGTRAWFWSSTELNSNDAYFHVLFSSESLAAIATYNKLSGASVRCIED